MQAIDVRTKLWVERDIAVAMAFNNTLIGDQLSIHTMADKINLPVNKFKIIEHKTDDGYHKFIIERTNV